MKKQGYQLLRQLISLQLLAVFLGTACISGAYFFVTRETFRKALKGEREKVILSVQEQQEKWRTWKQVGLEEALKHDLASHCKVFALTSLDVVPFGSLVQPLSEEEIAIPEHAAKEDMVVYGRLNRGHIEAAYVPYRSNLFLLGLCGGLFCLVIFFSARFIRKQIYLPFLELRRVFEACNAGQPVEYHQIVANGEIRDFISSLVQLYKKLKENEKNVAMVAVAKQVAHDIRSPLAALDMILDTLPQLPEQKRAVIRGALGRIRDIANNVLERSRRSLSSEGDLGGSHEGALMDTDPVSTQSIAVLVEEIATEKQVLVRDLADVRVEAILGDAAYGLFANVQPQPFKTVLSNLINNALESISKSGRVWVNLEARERGLYLTVSDNGRGIAAQVLEVLRTSGGSFGKETGMGLGLSHARSCVERWGGKLGIESQPDVGTTISIVLPLVDPPKWFVPQIEVLESSTVVVLDDDPSIHLVWQQRFTDAMKEAGVGIFLEHFSDTPSLKRWCTENQRLLKRILFLCDYEIIGANENGIDLIRSLSLTEQSILVTGRFDEEAIRVRCDANGIRLLPKGLGGWVPVRVRKLQQVVDAILLDDDPLVHMTWELAAKANEKTFQGYYSSADLLESAAVLDPATPVYVDRCLANGEAGEEIARRLVQSGFKEVYLATGTNESDLPPMPWLRGIRGKKPPWASLSGIDRG